MSTGRAPAPLLRAPPPLLRFRNRALREHVVSIMSLSKRAALEEALGAWMDSCEMGEAVARQVRAANTSAPRAFAPSRSPRRLPRSVVSRPRRSAPVDTSPSSSPMRASRSSFGKEKETSSMLPVVSCGGISGRVTSQFRFLLLENRWKLFAAGGVSQQDDRLRSIWNQINLADDYSNTGTRRTQDGWL